MSRSLLALPLFGLLACHGAGPTIMAPKPTLPPLPSGAPTPKTYWQAQVTDTRFQVADHFLASIEMQISGEPFAVLLGRNLAGYDRYSPTTDLYQDPTSRKLSLDPLGYSLAVESYEYSKQPMNNTSFESGAGLALEFGPVLNPDGVADNDGFILLRNRLQLFARESYARGYVVSPTPTFNPLNRYGWPGFWPAYAEFRSFDPTIDPVGDAVRSCTFVSRYAASAGTAQVIGDYECGYNSLNLPNRDQQVEKVLEPAALGYAAWKQALWVINYWQSVHDTADNVLTEIDDKDVAQIGQPSNLAVGRYPDPADPSGTRLIDGAPGVYLGDNAIEGWQGLVMIDELYNKAALLLGRLMTGDGTSLGGFATTAAALAYDYKSPLRWWPAAVDVVETGKPPPDGEAWKFFPQPTGLSIATPRSRLRDLTALIGGYAETFALTDPHNADVGGRPGPRATFDGDPWPADNLLPDGEETLHDRALAVIKVGVVDLDRLHFDPTAKVLVDGAAMQSGQLRRGTTVRTVDAAYAIVALRTVLRSISSTLTLYSNDTPDVLGGATALDGTKLEGAPASLPVRIGQLIRAEADFIADRLVDESGAVSNGYDLAAGKADASPTLIEAEAAAVRGLLEAFLATSDEKYRRAAARVYGDLDKRFWIQGTRAFRTSAGVDDTLTWTPLGFGALQAALRQYWKLVLYRPGSERDAAELLERLQRLGKLVLNGWDDANADNHLQYPDECTGGGLQMGERALTGEFADPADGADRDHDCVAEISHVKRPAALAATLVLHRRPSE